jgi:glycosyltransferase involved in cell wall biosynthesis
MARLSVVTPVFNARPYLEHTLRSVAALATPHEHIVIDAGSTDGTLELLRAWQERGVRWVSEPDRGQTHAVNKGLKRAHGDLLAWINGDDEAVPDAIDRAAAHFDAHSDCDVVYAGVDFIDRSGATRREYRPRGWSWHRFLLLGDYIPTPAIIFRRRRYEAVGPLDERWVDAADYDFYLRVMHGARVDRLPGAHVRFRYHAASKTATDVWRQQDEALSIRLQWSRTWRDRAVMVGFDRLKRGVLPALTRGRWPAPISVDAAP